MEKKELKYLKHEKVDCGRYASDWLATATCINLIDIVANEAARHVIYYFVPFANPLGYDYTWNNDRNWQKNVEG